MLALTTYMISQKFLACGAVGRFASVSHCNSVFAEIEILYSTNREAGNQAPSPTLAVSFIAAAHSTESTPRHGVRYLPNYSSEVDRDSCTCARAGERDGNQSISDTTERLGEHYGNS